VGNETTRIIFSSNAEVARQAKHDIAKALFDVDAAVSRLRMVYDAYDFDVLTDKVAELQSTVEIMKTAFGFHF
jgi:hypothetical protein